MQKRISVVCFAVVAVALLGLRLWLFPADSQAQESTLVDYDSFDYRYIDLSLWKVSSENLNRWGNAEIIREIDMGKKGKGQLHLGLGGYHWGTDSTAIGVRFMNEEGDGLPDVKDIGTIEAKVKVADCELGGNTIAYLEILGSFFSLVPGCTDPIEHEEEVVANIWLQPVSCDNGGEVEVMGGIFYRDTGIVEHLWTIEMNTSVTVSVEWNQVDHEFIFRMDGQEQNIEYGPSLLDGATDTNPPCSGFKDLRIKLRFLPPNSESDTITFMEVLIDEVRVANNVPWPTAPK